jgi:AcrR family transcriptional regulator
MATRLTRSEQTERNRSLVLRAARRVFLANGYHGASLEQIAEAAGFSKGVVYSQFESKADLFLALLEARIAERAAENARLVEEAGGRGLEVLIDHVARVARADPQWGLLVLEFRIHAVRDPELNRRYAAAHAKTLAGVAAVFATVQERMDGRLPFPPAQMAQFVLAAGAGFELEQAVDPEALGGPHAAELLTRLLTLASRPRSST